jgi:hypothetical protein
MAKSHNLREVTLFGQNTADLKRKPWKTIPNPMVRMPCLWDEWQYISLSQTAPCGIPGDLPEVIWAYQVRPYSWDQNGEETTRTHNNAHAVYLVYTYTEVKITKYQLNVKKRVVSERASMPTQGYRYYHFRQHVALNRSEGWRSSE